MKTTIHKSCTWAVLTAILLSAGMSYASQSGAENGAPSFKAMKLVCSSRNKQVLTFEFHDYIRTAGIVTGTLSIDGESLLKIKGYQSLSPDPLPVHVVRQWSLHEPSNGELALSYQPGPCGRGACDPKSYYSAKLTVDGETQYFICEASVRD